jgi:hypothetical protein
MKIPTGAKPETPRNIDIAGNKEERIKNPYVKELLTRGEALDAISVLARELDLDGRINGGQ